MLQSLVHYGIHFIVPVVIALVWFKNQWKLALLIMLSTMLIDLDHLLATPIFDANRCSINFHPLHSYYAIALYILLSFIKKTRILGIGCVIHMVADGADCLMM
jgi:multidrug efflux pump subunit AcrB